MIGSRTFVRSTHPNEIWLRTAVAIRSQVVANSGRREA